MDDRHSEYQTRSGRVKFIEAKRPDMRLVSDLLDECHQVNQWANFGPLFRRLADEYSEHMNLGAGHRLTPCANAGIALEVLARVQAAEAGQGKLRWVGSAFSFKNLGRGYFADMTILDCDAQGILDLAALEQMSLESFDGFVVTNPFGLNRDFDRFIQFAKTTGKKLLIDNAAGVGQRIPDWSWQAFSLHHTKPYGFGEGGLALSPDSVADLLLELINYDKAPADPTHWFNNGKISDIGCAFLIMRLHQLEHWKPGYIEQRERILRIAEGFGLTSLLPIADAPITNVVPLMFEHYLNDESLKQPLMIDIARQYEPIRSREQADRIYAHIINFPVHPDMQILSDAKIESYIKKLEACQIGA